MNRTTGYTTVAGSNIQGVGLSSASSFLLTTIGASAVLLSDGTNWNIIAGVQPRRAAVAQPGASSNYSTTSTSAVAVDGTNLSVSLQCSGAPVKVTFTGSACQDVAAQVLVIVNAMDGTASGAGAATFGTAAALFNPFCVTTVFNPAAGLHTFAPYWYVTSGGGGSCSAHPTTAESRCRP